MFIIILALFAENSRILDLLSGCCWYNRPVIYILYITFSWLVLLIDEIFIGHMTWLKALDVLNLSDHLSTGQKTPRTFFGKQIKHFPIQEMKSFDEWQRIEEPPRKVN